MTISVPASRGFFSSVLLLAAVCCLGGCGTTGPTTLTSSDGQFQITVFEGMSEASDLNDEADIQAANLFTEMYVVVLSEPKVDFEDDMTLEDYRDLCYPQFVENLGATMSQPEQVRTAADDRALQYDIHATVDKIKIGYLVTFIDTGTHFHQVLAWTLESKYGEHRPTLQKISASLKPTSAGS
ncbi:MAG: hypothetical protein RIK87_30480 [Fuerstiella sp.]